MSNFLALAIPASEMDVVQLLPQGLELSFRETLGNLDESRIVGLEPLGLALRLGGRLSLVGMAVASIYRIREDLMVFEAGMSYQNHVIGGIGR